MEDKNKNEKIYFDVDSNYFLDNIKSISSSNLVSSIATTSYYDYNFNQENLCINNKNKLPLKPKFFPPSNQPKINNSLIPNLMNLIPFLHSLKNENNISYLDCSSTINSFNINIINSRYSNIDDNLNEYSNQINKIMYSTLNNFQKKERIDSINKSKYINNKNDYHKNSERKYKNIINNYELKCKSANQHKNKRIKNSLYVQSYKINKKIKPIFSNQYKNKLFNYYYKDKNKGLEISNNSSFDIMDKEPLNKSFKDRNYDKIKNKKGEKNIIKVKINNINSNKSYDNCKYKINKKNDINNYIYTPKKIKKYHIINLKNKNKNNNNNDNNISDISKIFNNKSNLGNEKKLQDTSRIKKIKINYNSKNKKLEKSFDYSYYIDEIKKNKLNNNNINKKSSITLYNNINNKNKFNKCGIIGEKITYNEYFRNKNNDTLKKLKKIKSQLQINLIKDKEN